MPITLFPNDIPPYYSAPTTDPREVDEFLWDEDTLQRGLRHYGLLAKHTNGSWRVWQDGDGTYAGEIFEWRHRRIDPPWPPRFTGRPESEALGIAYLWAYASAV